MTETTDTSKAAPRFDCVELAGDGMLPNPLGPWVPWSWVKLMIGELDALRARLRTTEQELADYKIAFDLAKSELAECYRQSGADPDGNDDARLAIHAVEEVIRLRKDYDAACDREHAMDTRLAQLEQEMRDSDRSIGDRWADALHAARTRPPGE